MLMLANHKDNKFVLGNELLEIEKGQFVTSELKLMERWGWGKAKLRSFLKMLEKDEMIIKKSDRKKTTITICNYSVYHEYETNNRPQADHDKTDNRPRADTNKNVKNDKNVKEEIPYAEIVNYLNEKAGKKFKPSAKKTKEVIHARWGEGHRLDDFKQVINVCVEKWSGQRFSNGQNGDDYLQPSTLFNGKFDERLNWTSKQKPKTAERKKSPEQLEQERLYREAKERLNT